MAETIKVKSKSGPEKVREFLKGKPARTGAQLVKALVLSGTPESKLRAARERLSEEGTALTAEGVVTTLRDSGASEATVRKAEMIIATGTYQSVRKESRPIEDAVLAEEDRIEEKPKK